MKVGSMLRIKLVVLAMAVAAFPVLVHAQQAPAGEPAATSVPGSRAPRRVKAVKAKQSFLANPIADKQRWPVERAVALGALDTSQLVAEDAQLDSTPGTPMRIGVVRQLPSGSRSATTDGQWTRVGDDEWLWTLELRASEAKGMRVHFTKFAIPEGASVVLGASDGSVVASYANSGLSDRGEFWSHTIDGGVAYIAYRGPKDPALQIEVGEILHVYRGMEDPNQAAAANGLMPCQEDVNCFAVDQIAKDSVGRMFFVSGGGGFVCTGGLLNDVDPNTFAGYFLTANHCLSTQTVADTLQIRWFYESSSCNGPVSWTDTSVGATILSTFTSSDFTLLRLANDPTAGQGFAAWTATPPNGVVRGIHHPGGSYKRYSEGFTTTAAPICGSLPLSRYVYNDWTTGTTEGGSSGSPLFNTSWEVVGQLYGVCFFQEPTCTNQASYNNLYGRLSVSLTFISSFLNTVIPDDIYEDNDELAAAAAIGSGVHDLRLVDFDDYFAIQVTGGPVAFSASANFDTADMNLDLRLLSSTGTVIEESLGSGSSESLSQVLAPGDYVVWAEKVSGWGGDYSLGISLGELVAEPDGSEKDRAVSFIVPIQGAGVDTALRLSLVSLYDPSAPFPLDPPDFSAREGEVRYVNLLRDGNGDPVTTCQSSPAFLTSYSCATLGCDPEYVDWAGLFAGDVIQVSGAAIVPDSTYSIAQLSATCAGNEATCLAVSGELPLATARHGDVDASGSLDVTDVVLTVDVVKDIVGAVAEYRAYVRNETPQPHTDAANVTDIVMHVDALTLGAYPHNVPACP